MEKFTQKKNGQWMWSREYRDEMKKRLIWDDFPPETITKDDWIWSWSHTLTVSPKGIGQYDGASSDFVHRVFAVPVGEYLYLDKWRASPLQMATYRYVVLTDDEKQFIRDNIL